MTRVNPAIKGAGQGFFIDRKTAEANGITSIQQLSDPAVAALFDADGGGRPICPAATRVGAVSLPSKTTSTI